MATLLRKPFIPYAMKLIKTANPVQEQLKKLESTI